jgi:transposase
LSSISKANASPLAYARNILPGEKIFVDWAGPTVPIYHRNRSDITPASLFVAVLGASTNTFAEATWSQDLPNWVACHTAAFEYFNGTTKLIVPDNPRTGVEPACRYEPDLNRTYHEMAQHYKLKRPLMSASRRRLPLVATLYQNLLNRIPTASEAASAGDTPNSLSV